MSDGEIPFHYVCTREEARRLVDMHDRFWVCNCGCREGRGGCARSRIDLCLNFNQSFGGSGSGMHEIARDVVDGILREAEAKSLVARPFRNADNRSVTDGICFCCDDCCGYFLNPEEKCDKGAYAEATDMETCTHCGICVETCYFHARRMADDRLVVDHDKCYGCGFCAEVCPEKCVEMIPAR